MGPLLADFRRRPSGGLSALIAGGIRRHESLSEVDEASRFVVGAAVQLSESAPGASKSHGGDPFDAVNVARFLSPRSGPFLNNYGTQVPKDSLQGSAKLRSPSSA